MHSLRTLVLLGSFLSFEAGSLEAGPPAIPQATGQLHGTVTLDGVALDHAVVSGYLETPSGDSYSTNIVTVTGPDGKYNLTLPIGKYVVIVTVSGFRAYQGSVTINGSDNALNIALSTSAGSNSSQSSAISSPSPLESFTMGPDQVRLLSAGIFKDQVCVAVGNMSAASGHVKPFHIYVYATEQSPMSACPDFNKLRSLMASHGGLYHGNLYWQFDSIGQIATFKFPPIKGPQFVLKAANIEDSPPGVKIEIYPKN